MNCSSCGFENPAGMKFCGGCGSALATACPSCDSENPPGFSFCGYCGIALASRNPENTNVSAAFTDAGKPIAETAERRQITVVFCDLAHSTAMSERMDPEDLREVIREYQQVVANDVSQFGGHVAQYLGDGVLVYFGYPQAHEDAASRAMHFAVQAVRSVGELNQRLIRTQGIKLAVRIGIHTGDVVTGDMGTGQQTEKLAVGSTPNIAARLQAMADTDEVWVTEATLQLTDEAFEVEKLGKHKIRGISQPLELYRVLRASDPGNLSNRNKAPFIGRQRELGQILDLVELAVQGQGQVVYLTGEPGHGKTRLQQEVRNQTANRINSWLICRCSAYHENTTLHPFIDLLERMIGITPTQSSEDKSELFEQWIVNQSRALNDSKRYLASLLGISASGELADEAPELIHKGTHDALLTMIFDAADREPITLMIEDLHWADNTSLDLVDLLIRQLPRKRVMLFCSARPNFTPTWTPTDRQTFISLMRFGEEEARAFLRECAPFALPPAVEHEIIQRADGVPLYIEELMRTLRDKPDLTGNPQALSRSIPASLRDSLTSRLDSLGPAKEVVQIGALLGRRFPHEVLEAVSTLPADVLEDQLRRIVDSGLVRRIGTGPGASYAFKHALVQDAAYESLLKSRRRTLHEQVARALSNRFPALVIAQPELTARHMHGAELFTEATDAYRRAGARGASRWSLAESVRNYRQAVNCLNELPEDEARHRLELEIIGDLANPLVAYVGYGSDELAEIHHRSVELHTLLGEVEGEFAATANLWGVEASRGNRQRAWELANQIEDLARKSGNREHQMQAAFALGCTAFYGGQFQESISRLDVAVRLTQSDSSDLSRIRIQGFGFLARLIRSWANAIAGQPKEALDDLAMIERVCREANQPFALAQSLCHTCVVLQDLGADPSEVYARANETLKIAVDHDMGVWSQYAHLARGWARAKQGDLAGISELEHAVAAYTFDEVTKGHSLVMLADAYWHSDDSEKALESLDAALLFFENNLADFYQAEALRMKAEIYVRLGRTEEAESLLKESLQLSTANGARLTSARSASMLVEMHPQSEVTLQSLQKIVNEMECLDLSAHLVHAAELAAQSTATKG